MIKIITVYGGMLLIALGRTLLLALLGLFFACIIGMIFGIMGVLKNRACNIISQIFVDVIRGVPMIVLAFFVYFGVPYFFNTVIGGFSISLSALQAGTICLALNCGAYMAEIVRAGIQSVDKGQMEAARSLGLTYGMAMRKVVLPQAIKTMIPTTSFVIILILRTFIYEFPSINTMKTLCVSFFTRTNSIITERLFSVNLISCQIKLKFYKSCHEIFC